MEGKSHEQKRHEMHFEGDPRIFARLLLKKRLLEAGDLRHTEIRPLLYICGGGMKGVYGAGQVTALEKAGLTEVFDTVVGNSTGAPTGAYFLAGQAELGTTIYHDECATPKFISASRLLRRKKIMDAHYLADIFRADSKKKLLQERIRANRSAFYVITTDMQSGAAHYIDAKKLTDMVDGIQGSLAIPGFSNGEIEIEGTRHGDGGSAPLPTAELLERFAPTDILILANRAEVEPRTAYVSEKYFPPYFYSGLPRAVKRTFGKDKRNWLMNEGISQVRTNREVRAGIIWAPRSAEVHTLTQDKKVLRASSARAEAHLTELLAHASRIPSSAPTPRGSTLQEK